MKVSILLSLGVSYVAGHIISKRGHIAPRTVAVLAEQGLDKLIQRDGTAKLDNPDKEPKWKHPTSNEELDKPQILTGVGPAEADSRVFDWNQSCSDAAHRTKIVEAFKGFLILATKASEHLDRLRIGLPTRPTSKQNPDNRKHIWKTDQAYTQMFRGLDSKIDEVKKAYDTVAKVAALPPTDPSRAKHNAAARLRVICNADNKVMNRDGTAPMCLTPEDPNYVHAMTLPDWAGPKTEENDPFYKKYDAADIVEEKYRFDTTMSLLLCPTFFDNNKFPLFRDVDLRPRDQQTLDKVECAERVILHEYMHMPWTMNMPNEPDKVGWLLAAEFTSHGYGKFKKNPDNYAWFALYSYFNKACERDAWPGDGKDKPVPEP